MAEPTQAASPRPKLVEDLARDEDGPGEDGEAREIVDLTALDGKTISVAGADLRELIAYLQDADGDSKRMKLIWDEIANAESDTPAHVIQALQKSAFESFVSLMEALEEAYESAAQIGYGAIKASVPESVPPAA